jgi:hypothetical protein
VLGVLFMATRLDDELKKMIDGSPPTGSTT